MKKAIYTMSILIVTILLMLTGCGNSAVSILIYKHSDYNPKKPTIYEVNEIVEGKEPKTIFKLTCQPDTMMVTPYTSKEDNVIFITFPKDKCSVEKNDSPYVTPVSMPSDEWSAVSAIKTKQGILTIAINNDKKYLLPESGKAKMLSISSNDGILAILKHEEGAVVITYNTMSGTISIISWNTNVTKGDLQLENYVKQHKLTYVLYRMSPMSASCGFIVAGNQPMGICFHIKDGKLTDSITPLKDGKTYYFVKDTNGYKLTTEPSYPFFTCSDVGCTVYLSKDKKYQTGHILLIPSSPVIEVFPNR